MLWVGGGAGRGGQAESGRPGCHPGDSGSFSCLLEVNWINSGGSVQFGNSCVPFLRRCRFQTRSRSPKVISQKRGRRPEGEVSTKFF